MEEKQDSIQFVIQNLIKHKFEFSRQSALLFRETRFIETYCLCNMVNNLKMGITPFGTFLCQHCSTTGGLLWLIFAGYVPLASQGPYPIIVYSVASHRPPGPLPWIRHCFTFHLQYKHSGTFANRNYKELSYL